MGRQAGIRGSWDCPGNLIDTPDGRWFACLFRDYGPAGNIPCRVLVKWEVD